MENQQAIKHLKKDPILKKVIQSTEKEIKSSLELDIYHFLLDSIVSQQLSIKVADVIFNRFLDLFPERYPQPKHLINMDDEILRNAGLSYRKASYLKNVALFALENNIEFEHIQKQSNADLIALFTQIKGVGKWTVQMLLMFPLDRKDVFPVDDLGIQTNMKKLYNITSEKKELKQDLIKIAENWKPYRTLASKYIWNYTK
ncbi:MAG TPA: DNA-3-methyladenine glycosylase 2 family protein [Flavobacteriia bacterium]|nr:DNA-3-methyladenine glycosylase 2 family protein [Flavobacteriia bacterium]